MVKKEALEERRARKAKKPVFRRQDAHKKAKLSSAWRKPRGLQSKVRLKKKGYVRSPESGWRSPVAVRGLSREGLLPVLVSTEKMLLALDPKTEGAVVAASVGDRKRKKLLSLAEEKGIRVLNKPLALMKKAVEEREALRKEVAKARAARTEKKALEKKLREEEKKKAAAEQKKDEELSEEEKKKREKEEKDKVLTKRS
ncbi:50S ribosomal protein L32e [Candidatus Woesearchaeota archaeon]|nr:MAG: 50S ribosomal protein L32e [Candidatus Woesearchaeota archaeon]